LKLLFISNVLCQKYNKFYLRFKENYLAPFSGEESKHVISVKKNLDHLNYHDLVISGGSLGPNIANETP